MSFGAFKRGTVVVALAAAAMLAAPAMAQAVGTYPADDSAIVQAPSATVAPGGAVVLGFGAGSFDPGATVSFSLTGESASGATLATMRAAVETLGASKNAAGDGSLTATHKLPQNAAGTYTLTAAVPGWSRTWTFSIAGQGAAAGGSAGSGDSLVTTGAASNELLWAWVAGGGLALVGGGIVVANSVRKQKKLAA